MLNKPARPASVSDSEKITINLGFVDLGSIDLIVADGFYSNRTDFIRTAIRNQLEKYQETLKQSTTRNQFVMGMMVYSRAHLEKVRRSKKTVDVRVIGLARIADDVDADLARATIASVNVLGSLQASPAVKAALADRMSA